jgi:hypothetical protein
MTGDLLDDSQGFRRGQVKGRGKFLSGGATMDTAQVASGCQLPEDQAWDEFGGVHGRTIVTANLRGATQLLLSKTVFTRTARCFDLVKPLAVFSSHLANIPLDTLDAKPERTSSAKSTPARALSI